MLHDYTVGFALGLLLGPMSRLGGVLGLFRRRGPRPWLRFEVTWYPTSKRHAPPRQLLHVGAARRRGHVRPYLNLYAHPGLMYELYAGLTLGRSEA